jgi:hypothetical protein
MQKIIICLFLLIFSINLKAQKFVKTTVEPRMSLKIYSTKYEHLKFSCDSINVNEGQNIRQHLIATSLFNDLSKKYKLGVRLKTKIYTNKGEINEISIKFKGKDYYFEGACSNETKKQPTLNSFIDLLPTDLSRTPLKYNIVFNEKVALENWFIFMGQLTLNETTREIFMVRTSPNEFIKQRVYLKENKMYETRYNNETGLVKAEGPLVIQPEKRDTVVRYNPEIYDEEEVVFVYQAIHLRDGVWTFYLPNGKIKEKRTYILGEIE